MMQYKKARDQLFFIFNKKNTMHLHTLITTQPVAPNAGSPNIISKLLPIPYFQTSSSTQPQKSPTSSLSKSQAYTTVTTY